MEKIRIKNLEEDVYYEKLDNGLEVYKESEKASIESMIEAMCD